MIRVTGPRVLVAIPPPVHETVTASGIILPRDPDRRKIPTRGIVVALGEKTGTVDLDEVLAAIEDVSCDWRVECATGDIRAAVKRLAPAAFEVELDDCVLFPAIAGEELEIDGQAYVIVHESDIVGVVEPKERAA